MSDEEWTINRLLSWTTDYLKSHGVESPRLDAEVLLAEARKCERIELYTHFDEVADESLRATFRGLVQQRAKGVPVAYLVGHREFYSLSFLVTPDVLIPRPETEFLVVALLDRAKQLADEDSPMKIADVGTGSGIIAICAALNLAGAHVTAIDLSQSALEVAQKNAQRHGVAERIEFVESDLLSSIDEDERFHIISSNPPYVSETELASAAAEVRDHEPRLALVAGQTGTEVIEPLIDQSVAKLRPNGWLIMEISPMIANDVHRLIDEHSQLDREPTIKDLDGHPRVVVARRQSVNAD